MFTLIEDYKKRDQIGKFVEADGVTYEIEVFYDLGGMSYFTGQTVARGYWLSVTPVEKGNGWRRFTAFAGTKYLLQETKRFSRSVLEKIAGEYLSDIEHNPLINKLYQHVTRKQ
jgi:hypothetical protein